MDVEFADIYYYAAKLGFDPRAVDGWTPAETAYIFGIHRPDDDSPGGHGPVREGIIDDESERLIAARFAAARGEGPPPEAPAYGTEDLPIPP